jgi:hypothetical protein
VVGRGKCSWCLSPARQVAEEAIADGVEIAEVARSYRLSRDQWYKHRHHGTLVKQGAASLSAVRLEVLEGGGGPYTVIPRLEELLLQVDDLKVKWGSKPSLVVSLLRLERDVLGDIAKLRGEHMWNARSVGKLAVIYEQPHPELSHLCEKLSRFSICTEF